MFSEVFGEEEPSVAAASPAVPVDAQAASSKSELHTGPPERQKHPFHAGASQTGGVNGSSRRRPRVNGLQRGRRGGGRSGERLKEADSSESVTVRESHSGDSEPSADTSDSQGETESASSPESSDSEGEPRKTQKLWRPPTLSSAAAAAALKLCDPWLAAAADRHGSAHGRDERERLKILIDDIERALHNVAHGAPATAAASSAGEISAAERERGEDEASLFAVKVLSRLETLNNLQRQRSEQQQHHQQKAQKTDCFLHTYQKSGALWILQRFAANLNCIVADEMGLGKTLQALAVYVYLRRFGGATFEGKPALVVCPLSVVGSWLRHCTHFLGAVDLLQQQQKPAAAAAADVGQEPLRLLTFVGDAATRADMQRKVLDMQKSQQTVQPEAAPLFDILLTSYELAAREIGFLSQFCFSLLIIDEASRLKSPKGAKRRALAAGIKRDRTLLLTGTPIENSLGELFSLLQFLHPSLFLSSEAFISIFYKEKNTHRQGTGGSVARTPEINMELLKRIVSTFVLRRTVLQAQHSWRLPPLREVVLLLPLTPLQRRLYLWLLTRDSRLILSSRTASAAATEIIKGIRNLNNLFIQLRKASNHPLLFRMRRNAGAPPLGSLLRDEGAATTESQAEAETHAAASSDDEEGDAFYEKHLMSASNKLLALHRIVSFCLSRGEKIVVFSYSTNMLDLAEDLLLESGIRPARLDGNTSETDRRAALEAFLRSPQMAGGKDEDDTEWSPMVLLMSVLAGAYGLNLVSSSSNSSSSSSSVCRCCVFLEGGGGGNPQVERQAIARLHRQGQTQRVIAIRLISKHTVEEVLYRRGSAKLRLSDNVLAAAVSATAPAAAAATGRAAETEPLRSLQSFDCEVLSSSLLFGAEQRQATPEAQRKEIAELLQFGAAALAVADSSRRSSSTRPDGYAAEGETDPFSALPIEPILTKAFSAGAAAAGAVPATEASAQKSKDISAVLSVAFPPSPLASLPEAAELQAGATADEERQKAAEEKREAPEESIYYFEQQDFTSFVRRDRRWEDDGAAIETFAASAVAAAKEKEEEGRGLSEKEMRRPPEETAAARRLRLQRQRAERLEKLWASQNYISLALRLAGEPSPHYFCEAAAAASEEAGTRDKGDELPAGGNKAVKPQLAIPAESFFVFPPLQHDEGFSGVSEHMSSLRSSSNSSNRSTDADRYVHYRVGDATCPQSFLGAPEGPRIICLFVETGGRWVSGGFFKAVDQLGAMPQKALEKAKKCHDLHGGDVHLVKIREGLCVALAVCITEENKGKRGSGGFFVRARDLLRCLRLLSIYCKRHRASLHLPRCSTPCRYGMEANMGRSSSTNALVFKLLQETFAKRKVHAVTYILPRGDRRNTRGDTRGPQSGSGNRNPPRGGSSGASISAAAGSKNTTMQQRGPTGWSALRKRQMIDKQPQTQPNAEQQQQQQHHQAAKRHHSDETAQRGAAAADPESICTRIRGRVSGEALPFFQSVTTKREKGGQASHAGEMPGGQPVPQLASQLAAPATSAVTVQQQPQQQPQQKQPQQTQLQQPHSQQQQPQKLWPKQLQQQGQVPQPYQEQQPQKEQISQPQRALRDCGVAWVLHESVCESVRIFLYEALKAAGATVGLESADIHHAAGSLHGDPRADCSLIYLIVGLNYLQQVLTLAQQQQERPVMHAAFARLSASLVDAVKKDKKLGRIATLWGFRGALLQLPWSSAFFRVSLPGEKGEKESVAALLSARLLRIRIEFSDYAEAAAASGCFLSPVEWRGGFKSWRDAWGEAASEGDTSDTPAARETRDTKWERARVQIRKGQEAEALHAAATPMSIGRGECFVKKAIPAELFAALQLWENENRAQQLQPEQQQTAYTSLDFYGVAQERTLR